MDRQRRMEALKAELTKQLAAGNGALAIDRMLALLVDMERDNERLAWRVLLANRYRFGCSTEKLSGDELRQLYLAFGGDSAVAESETEPPVPAPGEPEQVEATAAETTLESVDDSADSPEECVFRADPIGVPMAFDRRFRRDPIRVSEHSISRSDSIRSVIPATRSGFRSIRSRSAGRLARRAGMVAAHEATVHAQDSRSSPSTLRVRL